MMFMGVHEMFMFLVVCVSFFNISHCVTYPCFTNWKYLAKTGKCYFIVPEMANFTDAKKHCNSILSQTFPTMTDKVSLSEIRSLLDAEGLSEILLNQGNNEPQFISATWNANSKIFKYPNNDIINVTEIAMDSVNISGNCLMYTYKYNFAGQYKKIHMLKSMNCSKKISYVCEHTNVKCNKDDISGFDGATMIQDPPDAYIELPVTFKCRRGYYRVNPNNDANIAKCVGAQDSSLDPSKFSISWSRTTNSFIQPCIAVQCFPPFPDVSGISVNSTISVPTESVYNFGYKIFVRCSRGYVNYRNPYQTISAVHCDQSTTEETKGEWHPKDSSPCLPVTCSKTDLLYQVPVQGFIVSTRHKRTQKVILPHHLEDKIVYDTIVTLSCKPGEFFPDRKVEKNLICGLLNDSLTIAKWVGYNGDHVPFAKSCINVTCTYEDVLIKDSMNIKVDFNILQENGSVIKLKEHSGEKYKLNTKLQFNCKAKYKTATQDDSHNLTCGIRGKWHPQLTSCIEETALISTGKKKRYVPPIVEASAAKEVGYVAIIILVVFLSLIILLDLSTFTRDIQLMKRNINYLKKLRQMRKDSSVKTD